MNHSESSAIARILASPFQQRINAGSAWGAIVVVALCASPSASFLAWSLVADAAQAPAIRHGAAVSGVIAAAALLVAGWMMLIGNLLQQNRPAMARLVPGHVARLRAALLLAWALAVLAITAGPGFALEQPLAWACGAAGGLALLAAALRWPVLWIAGFLFAFVVLPAMAWQGPSSFAESVQAQWRQSGWLLTAIVATAGAAALAAILSDGGGGTRAPYDAGHALGRLFADSPQAGCARRQVGAARPYAAWLERQLARRDSPVSSRLLLGLGPAVHWTMRIRHGLVFVAVGGGICAVVVGLAAFLGRDLRGVLPWLSFSLLTGASTPALQAAAQLYRTQREQALLVLLPGVPRGAGLNRWLAWQMTALFVFSAMWGFLLAGALDVLAEVLQQGLVKRSGGGDMTAAIVVALLPQVVFQWRSWARVRGASGQEFLPSLTPFLLGGVALLLHLWAGVAYLPMGLVFMGLAIAYCAWRWWRMGSEPTAMPIGRLAR
ncbi:hypothetical protein [Scleromatobacter humisilvae]|uniref:Uncharacterized protein n=1 Tax=Scleromatobacter humisilvae TaxID=2897159 RepID=A0A9X1YQN2_9BURK|nr:hypothetical protein [Scleromatobacter humisilvae]MCK9689257.1 hypothetical protein [Scleromatobacter humisilvae]